MSPPAHAARATFGVFAGSGLLISSWSSRIPAVRQGLGLDPAQLGLVLLALSVGSVLGLPTAGAIVGRLGSRRTICVVAPLSCTGMAVAAIASSGPVSLLAVGLFLVGIGFGVWDVAMNVEGVAVERELGRAIMPRFHAGFSVGTVVGALVGAGLQALGVSVRLHLLVVSCLLFLVVPLLTRWFVPAGRHAGGAGARGKRRPSARGAWLEPRTVLIGLLVLTFAFTEGTGNDWLAVATVDGYHQPAAVGSLVFGVFVSAMTVGRFTGNRVLDRFGRVSVLRVSCAVAALGVASIVLGPDVGFVIAGAALWGLGASLGFPVGMSAAADDPAFESARVGVVSSIAYCAFLAGPPLVGFLGNQVGVRHALVATAVLALAGLALAGNARRQQAPELLGGPRAAPAAP